MCSTRRTQLHTAARWMMQATTSGSSPIGRPQPALATVLSSGSIAVTVQQFAIFTAHARIHHPQLSRPLLRQQTDTNIVPLAASEARATTATRATTTSHNHCTTYNQSSIQPPSTFSSLFHCCHHHRTPPRRCNFIRVLICFVYTQHSTDHTAAILVRLKCTLD